MWTQRDQLQAFQFLRRRLVSALQFGDANHPVAPGRRVVVATAFGLGAMLLICGGFVVFAVLHPGSTADWRRPGQILIEKESGAGFVLGADGLVHPVLNYASARLLIGGDRTTSIPAKSLAGAPRGRPLGIPGAPASLAAPGSLIKGPWAVCVTAGGTPPAAGSGAGQNDSGQAAGGQAATTVTTLVIGRPAPQRQLSRGQGMIVAVPEGPELALLNVANSGDTGPRLAGKRTRVGQVLLAKGVDGEDRYYLATRKVLVPIGQTEAALIVGNPQNQSAYPDGVARPVTLSAADITASGLVAPRTEEKQYPARLPELVRGDGPASVLCAGGTGAGPTQLWSADAPPLPAGGRALLVAAGARTSGAADQVYVTPGSGLLATEPPKAGNDDAAKRQGADKAAASPAYLVTDQGVRFRLRDRDDAAALGYSGAPAHHDRGRAARPAAQRSRAVHRSGPPGGEVMTVLDIDHKGRTAMPPSSAVLQPFDTSVSPAGSVDEITVSIVEDHPLYRVALARLIDGLPGFALGPVAGSVEEFLAYRTRPGGVVLLDLNLPGRQGPAAALAVTDAGHRPLVISARADQADVLAVLAAGARGYLTKSAEAEEIAAAIRQIAGGGTCSELTRLAIGEGISLPHRPRK